MTALAGTDAVGTSAAAPALAVAADTILSVEDLVAGYRRPVVGPVSFHVSAGESVGVRGPNGAGKSTLLKAIGGTARIFSGRVVRHRPGLRVAHQQQNPLPLEDIPLSGRELLRLTAATVAGLPDWILPLVDRRLDRLSGGQLQFLQVWACLTAPVDLVLLDEPTNNLDIKGTAHMIDALAHMRNGPALVTISHDPEFLEAVCTRVVEIGA
jgi:ATPase subunit of ABC transporter with duplicated ATPase domains